MTSFLRSVGKFCWSGRYGLAIVLVIGLSGCQNWNMRGDGFADDDLASTARQARPQKDTTEYWGYSEKARQIERDFQGH